MICDYKYKVQIQKKKQQKILNIKQIFMVSKSNEVIYNFKEIDKPYLLNKFLNLFRSRVNAGLQVTINVKQEVKDGSDNL
jgi:hypothetical protein